jgi:hypothetical protein
MPSNDRPAAPVCADTPEIEPGFESARRAWDSPSLKIMATSAAELGAGAHPDAEGTS